MAISLSDLTGASTSGNVLNEVNSYADFLDSVPRLVNKADPSGATDAVQTVATKQPIALPLTKDSNGVLGGYLYQPDVIGNAPAVEIPTINANEDFVFEMEVYLVNATSFHLASGVDANNRFGVHSNAFYFSPESAACSPLSTGASTLTVERSGTTATLKQDGVVKATLGANIADNIYTLTHLSHNGQFTTSIGRINGYIKTATLSIEGTEVFNCDFTSPRIPHGATEFECETGQVVTVNTSGNNPSKVIKKPVLRYDGVDDFMDGVLGQTITGGYMFAAFSVNGDGGNAYGRILGLNSAGSFDSLSGGVAFRRNVSTTGLMIKYNSSDIITHSGFFDDERGDYLLEAKVQDGSQQSKVNNADADNGVGTVAGDLSAEEFSIASLTGGGNNEASIDLEYLALFPATLTDSQADQVRSFINNRNKVFYRWDTDGYYFFDGAATDDGQVFTGSGSWNGRIVGSDNGDSDFYISQNTLDDRPTSDGYKITFADNTDHFDIPSTTQAGWQIVGTSLGTFAYKVNANAVTELNLLGNVGNAAYRKGGDLYGIILLPESATNRDIEEARKLLIDRGAADGTAQSGSIFANWFDRTDIVEFKHIDTSSITYAQSAWLNNTSLKAFPELDLSNSTSFVSTWRNCSSLTQFPQDAKLGTEATNVNFAEAWWSSGLTSFPALDLSKGNNFTSAWKLCSSLQSFPEGALLGTEATNVNFAEAWRSSGLTSFSTPLPSARNIYRAWRDCGSLGEFNLTSLPDAYYMDQAWYNCSSLESFSTELPKAYRVDYAWANCSSLTNFSADVFSNWNPSILSNVVFNGAWLGCTSLTAQSVENILVPIANSGKWATSTGLEGGTALTDATIDIDYNVATGSLTAATLSAIETLNGRGWSVNINNEIIVPNILQLQPAAAYSLRSFDSDADPTVVNVRRSSDGALSDFTASQVSDGTLTSWVNTEYDIITPTAANGGFESGTSQWTFTSASIDTSVAYSGTQSARLDVVAGAYSQVSRGVLSVGLNYRVGFWAKTSDITKQIRVEVGSQSIPINFTTTDWEYKEVEVNNASSILLRLARNTTSGDYTVNIDNITLTQLTADGYVTTWYDQSGSGNNSTQSTASAQPLIVENGVLVTEGGEAALSFDGVANLDFSYLSLANNFTIFNVVNPSDNARTLSLDGSGAPRIDFENGSPDAVEIVSNGFSGANKLDLATSNVVDNQILFSLINNSSNISVFQNGIASSENPLVISGNFTFGQIGGSLAQLHQEVIFFNTDQSANRAAIENNINDHFNIY